MVIILKHQILDVIDKLGIEIVPYIVLLVIPVLSRMSDQCESVRQMASHSFATLVKLMPLEVSGDQFCFRVIT